MSSLLQISTQVLLLCICFISLQPSTESFEFLSKLRQKKSDKILAHLIGQKTLDDLHEAGKGNVLVTDLDRQMRHLFVDLRRYSMKRSNEHMAELYEKNRAQGKMQEIIPETEPFPCDLSYARSTFPPTSVHELRPGDIDVIASIGDSLSAGNGIMSDRVLHILNEFRAFSFAGGGYGDWRSYLTLPNILKVFNPNLYGYATENELTIDSTSHLNIAEPMIMSRDLPYQVSVLIERMRQDPNIDVKNHWKLLTIFVGNNDICSDMCHHTNKTDILQRHELDLRRAFTLLRDNLPRMVVNLMTVPNLVATLHQMQNVPLSCFAVHHLGCHCLFSHNVGERELLQDYEFVERWHEVDQYIAQLPEFQTNDFTILYQPFIAHMNAPKKDNGEVDYRYFASDCFHFSQLGHASLANTLFNSMMQPMGRKSVQPTPAFGYFECPTEERPFIATLYNSWQST